MLNIWPYFSVNKNMFVMRAYWRIELTKWLWFVCLFSCATDDDKCESCPGILEELETIDDDTDDHGIQFVKSNDVKLAHEIGIFSFPALVYYETGVPIMYDGVY